MRTPERLIVRPPLASAADPWHASLTDAMALKELVQGLGVMFEIVV